GNGDARGLRSRASAPYSLAVAPRDDACGAEMEASYGEDLLARGGHSRLYPTHPIEHGAVAAAGCGMAAQRGGRALPQAASARGAVLADHSLRRAPFPGNRA